MRHPLHGWSKLEDLACLLWVRKPFACWKLVTSPSKAKKKMSYLYLVQGNVESCYKTITMVAAHMMLFHIKLRSQNLRHAGEWKGPYCGSLSPDLRELKWWGGCSVYAVSLDSLLCLCFISSCPHTLLWSTLSYLIFQKGKTRPRQME